MQAGELWPSFDDGAVHQLPVSTLQKTVHKVVATYVDFHDLCLT
jgi:hypothetical protein